MEFEPIQWQPQCLDGSDNKEMLLQWNIDDNLNIARFRYTGANLNSSEEYMEVVLEFLKYAGAYGILGINGTADTPFVKDIEELRMNQLSMELFDKLQEGGIVSQTGSIRGCFEETYNNITVGDKLREVLVNEDSENNSLFTEHEKSEVLYQLFKIFVVGGTLCQPDITTKRYLDITKKIYKELLTVFK